MFKILVLAFSMLVLSANFAKAKDDYFICYSSYEDVAPLFFFLNTNFYTKARTGLSEEFFYTDNENKLQSLRINLFSDSLKDEDEVYFKWDLLLGKSRLDNPLDKLKPFFPHIDWKRTINKRTLELTATEFSSKKEISWQCELVEGLAYVESQQNYTKLIGPPPSGNKF